MNSTLLPTNITFIQRGWANANHVVIRGEQTVLIDSGHTPYIEETLATLRSADVDPASIDLIINTHGHWDHCGGSAALRDLSGAVVMMGPLTAQWMREYNRRKLWHSHFGVTAAPCIPDQVIQSGDCLRLGGLEWQVLSLPGHAPDTIGLFQPDHAILICADALHPGGDMGVINISVHGWEALDAAEQAVGTMIALQPRLAIPGHGGMITDPMAQLGRLQKRLERFRQEPMRMLQHFTRRILVAVCIDLCPIERLALERLIMPLEWVEDYAQLMNVSHEQLIQQTLEPLLQAGIVYEQAGLLRTDVPR